MIKRFLILLLGMLLGGGMLFAQNNTHSPFSRFGYGELNDNVPGAYRALGGVGIGVRDKRVINSAQPASFTVVDSTTFMFDLAASGMWNQYKDGMGAKNRGNGNLEYLTLQMPIYKQWIGLSLGVMPYSMVGYDFYMRDSINSDYHYATTYEGKGGITEIYGGLSFNICNWFALGANVYYMFGDVTNSRSLTFSEALDAKSESTLLHVNDVRFRYGAQFFHQFDKCSFVLGAIFENKSSLNGDILLLETTGNDTITNSNVASDFPMIWGVGGTFCYGGRFQLSADYTRYCWGTAQYFNPGVTLQDRQKIAVGFEYTHNPLGRRYIDHMPWRVGFSMADPYVANVPGKEYVVSIGTAFPLHNVATVFNTSLEYGHRGSASALQENFLRLTVNVSVSENWFFKRRL